MDDFNPKKLYDMMEKLGEKIDGVKTSTDKLSERIEEVNTKISADVKKLEVKQINDHQNVKVLVEAVSNHVTDNKTSADNEVANLKLKFEEQCKRLDKQEQDMANLKKELDGARKTIKAQSTTMIELEKSVHRGLQHGRGWNIEIEGVPVNVGDDPGQLQDAVIRILEGINVHVEPYDIDSVHRLPSNRDGPKPTIVRFISRKTVRLTHQNKYKLKDLQELDIDVPGIGPDSKIYINASQCPYYKTLAFNCRLLKRKGLITSHFTGKDGRISIKTVAGDNIKVTHESDLTQTFPLFQEFNFKNNHRE